jgi:hypothetical protein
MYMSKLLFNLLLALLVFSACVETPLGTEDTLTVAQIIKDQAPLGWQLNKTVLSGSEMQGLTQGKDYSDQADMADFTSMAAINGESQRLQKILKTELGQRTLALSVDGITTDSLIFFEDNKMLGIRKALYYNQETDRARYYEVKYVFAAWRNITYDSTEARATLNHTLSYGGDDHLQTLNREQIFKTEFFVRKITSAIEITDYDGSNVTGAKAATDTYYIETWPLAHKKQFLQITPDKTGTLREDFDFQDGKTAYNLFTIRADGTGIFEKKLRDGLLISGTFDSAEQDLHGSYTELTDFPAGPVDKVYKEAEITITLPDSVFYADFLQTVYFTSGEVDSESVALQVSEQDGFKTSVFEINKFNGAHGTLTIVEGDQNATLQGTWTTWDNYFIVVSAEYYFDQSAHLHYEVFQTQEAYNAGESPLIIADYNFSPDQSGSGQIAYGSETYDVAFDGSGTGQISQGTQKTKISLY